MTVGSVAEIAANFADFLKASEQGPVVVMRNGKPVAVLLGTSDPEELERLLMGHSRQLQKILEAARKRFRAGAGIPHEVFWKDIEAENAGKTKKRSRTRKAGRAPT
jgi:prevent-host-death family protein